jgi:branched-chain amino acid transport system substrate-binding protein
VVGSVLMCSPPLVTAVRAVVKMSGGTVIGQVRHPLNTSDFSSFLLQAQSSKAQIIGLASAGADTINSVKQAAEYRIAAGGRKLAGLVVVISDIHALGLRTANGLVFTTAFYWDRDEASRAWSKRFFERTSRMPGMVQAGTYSAVLHYLKALQVAGTADGKATLEADFGPLGSAPYNLLNSRAKARGATV